MFYPHFTIRKTKYKSKKKRPEFPKLLKILNAQVEAVWTPLSVRMWTPRASESQVSNACKSQRLERDSQE